MKKLWLKIRLWTKVSKILITNFFYKIIHRIKGQKLSKQGAGLRDYVYEILTNPQAPQLTCNGYQKMMYEEMIESCMKENNISRDTALVQIFITLMNYDEEE